MVPSASEVCIVTEGHLCAFWELNQCFSNISDVKELECVAVAMSSSRGD